jgi:hypothetical protein
MTRQEAYDAMADGTTKCTHNSFVDYEYIYRRRGIIVTEDDINFEEIFWTSSMFEDGWSIK